MVSTLKEGLHHDFSQCSTQLREGDGDLGEGSLSCFISEDGLRSRVSTRGACVPRQRMVLVQLKRLAPKAGRLTAEGSRVPRADRQYDLLLEPGERLEEPAVLRETDGGFEPWQSSLRKSKVHLRPLRPLFRPAAPPLQLVTALHPPRTKKPRKRAAAAEAPRQTGQVDRGDDVGDFGPLVPVSVPVICEPLDAVSECSSLGLPASLNEELQQGNAQDPADPNSNGAMNVSESIRASKSKDLVHWAATWPLNVPPSDVSASLSSYSGGPSQEKPRSPEDPGDHRYSVSARRLSERRRSWLKASEASKGKNPGFVSQRNQLREMVSTMIKTMTQTFDRSVWHACDVLHPDEEIEQAHARQQKVLEDQIDQFKGLKPAIKGRRKSQRRESTRRSFGITAGGSMTRVTPPLAIAVEKPDEKVLAHLAKQTGWSVLDVEEVWEVFSSHAPTGRIGVQSQDFTLLVQEIYDGVTDEEIILLQQHMRAVRTRNKARSRMMRRALTGGLEATTDKSEIRFSEFYVALVKWLTLQEARVEAARMMFHERKSRCSLKRFAYQETFTVESREPYGGLFGVTQALMAQQAQRKASDGSQTVSDSSDDAEDDEKEAEEQHLLMVPDCYFQLTSPRSSAGSISRLL